MALKLRRGLVAIAPIEDPDTTDGGIIIPDSAKQRLDQGIVVYKGAGVDSSIKIGDHVFFNGYAGTQMTISGEGFFFIMSDKAITATLEGSENWIFTDQMLEEAITQTYAGQRSEGFPYPGDVEDFLEAFRLVLKQLYIQKGLMF